MRCFQSPMAVDTSAICEHLLLPPTVTPNHKNSANPYHAHIQVKSMCITNRSSQVIIAFNDTLQKCGQGQHASLIAQKCGQANAMPLSLKNAFESLTLQNAVKSMLKSTHLLPFQNTVTFKSMHALKKCGQVKSCPSIQV